MNPKVSRGKKITNIREEINDIETKRKEKRLMKQELIL